MMRKILEIFDKRGHEGDGDIVSGQVGRVNDGQRTQAGSGYWENEIGVIGWKIFEPEKSFGIYLRINFRKVAHVSKRQEPSDKNGYLEDIKQRNDIAEAFLFHCHFPLVISLLSDAFIASLLTNFHLLHVDCIYLLKFDISQALKLSTHGRVSTLWFFIHK